MDEQYEEICRRNSIREYLEAKGYQMLKCGKHYKCKCPIPGHNETDPSFYITVKPDGVEFFKCYGCGGGGNIISLLHLVEGVKKGEIIQRLAKSSGIILRDMVGLRSEPLPQEVMEIFCEEDAAADLASSWTARLLESVDTPDIVSRIARLYAKMDEMCDVGDNVGVQKIRTQIGNVVMTYDKGEYNETENTGRSNGTGMSGS